MNFSIYLPIAANSINAFLLLGLGGLVGFLSGLFGVGGGILGVQLVKILRATGNADFVIKITYVAMLGIIGGYMFMESLQSLKKAPLAEELPASTQKTPSFYARLIP